MVININTLKLLKSLKENAVEIIVDLDGISYYGVIIDIDQTISSMYPEEAYIKFKTIPEALELRISVSAIESITIMDQSSSQRSTEEDEQLKWPKFFDENESDEYNRIANMNVLNGEDLYAKSSM